MRGRGIERGIGVRRAWPGLGRGQFRAWGRSRVSQGGLKRVDGVRWVRSWILFRLAIITQGIAARAALGQASSADARADSRGIFDFFGRMAWEAKEEAESEAKITKAKL